MNDMNLGELGTVAFDLPIMRRLICIDPADPSQIAAGDWIEMVPEHLRAHAYYACSAVLNEIKGKPLTDERLKGEVVSKLQAAVFDSIEMCERREARLRPLIQAFYREPPPVDLDDLEAVVEQMHHYLEGAYHFAVPLLRRVIHHHKDR